MSTTEAISILAQVVEQTAMIPADYRKCAEALSVLTELSEKAKEESDPSADRRDESSEV